MRATSDRANGGSFCGDPEGRRPGPWEYILSRLELRDRSYERVEFSTLEGSYFISRWLSVAPPPASAREFTHHHCDPNALRRQPSPSAHTDPVSVCGLKAIAVQSPVIAKARR